MKIFESFEDILGITGNGSNETNPDDMLDNMLGAGKKKVSRPKKVVVQQNVVQKQNIEQQNIIQTPKVPEYTVSNVIQQQITQKAQQHTEQINQEIIRQQVIQEALETQNPPQELEEKVTEVLETLTGEDMSDVNGVEVIKTTEEAFKEVSNPDLTLDDVEILPSKTKKDKNGFFKTKVSIKKDNIPELINQIASIVKHKTSGIVSPRVCDLRVISNTNKTQLRGSSLKLSAATVVFKPDANKLKVNKGTRIMLSVPGEKSSKNYSGNLLVYLQESRAKTILEVSRKDFDSEDSYANYLAFTISNYYSYGYEVTLKKLQLRGTNNPLVETMQLIVGTGDFKVKPIQAPDGNIYRFEVISKREQNQWLRVIVDTVMTGMYRVYALNDVTKEEYIITRENLSLNALNEHIIYILNKSYERDWSKELGKGTDTEIPEIYYMLNKLQHRKLRMVAYEIWNSQQPESSKTVFDYPVCDSIELLKAASKRDMRALQHNDYDAEMLVGKTEKLQYFYLTYLAYPIIGGDRRNGKDYITKDDYYQKYDVTDRSQYSKRKNTVLTRENSERNYNSRIYLFQLEYGSKDKKNVFRAKTFKEILEKTQFLTDTPNFEAVGMF